MGNVKITTTDKFTEDVINTKKPTVVYFWAEWCQPCKQLGPIYEAYANSQDAIEMYKVDVDAEQALTQPFNIMGIPTLLLFKEGKVVSQHTGGMTKEQLQKFSEQ